MEEGAVMMVGFNLPRIINALSILKDQKRGEERTLKIVKDYDVLNVSDKVLRIIISYIDYINRIIWQK
jgi:UDP-N-acetylglucosamine 2-epimerase (non-hydrolysing)